MSHQSQQRAINGKDLDAKIWMQNAIATKKCRMEEAHVSEASLGNMHMQRERERETERERERDVSIYTHARVAFL